MAISPGGDDTAEEADTPGPKVGPPGNVAITGQEQPELIQPVLQPGATTVTVDAVVRVDSSPTVALEGVGALSADGTAIRGPLPAELMSVLLSIAEGQREMVSVLQQLVEAQAGLGDNAAASVPQLPADAHGWLN